MSRHTLLPRALVVIALALVPLLLTVACEQKPAATTTPEDPAGRAQCFANQQAIELAVQKQLMETNRRMPSNYGQVKSGGFVSELLWCPAGGDMIWVPTEGGFMTCSIHGRWSDYPASP